MAITGTKNNSPKPISTASINQPKSDAKIAVKSQIRKNENSEKIESEEGEETAEKNDREDEFILLPPNEETRLPESMKFTFFLLIHAFIKNKQNFS